MAKEIEAEVFASRTSKAVQPPAPPGDGEHRQSLWGDDDSDYEDYQGGSQEDRGVDQQRNQRPNDDADADEIDDDELVDEDGDLVAAGTSQQAAFTSQQAASSFASGRSVLPEPFDPTTWKADTDVISSVLGMVSFVWMGTAADFANVGRARVTYSRLKSGCKKEKTSSRHGCYPPLSRCLKRLQPPSPRL